MGVHREINGREGDVSQETSFSTLEKTHKEQRDVWEHLPGNTVLKGRGLQRTVYICRPSYLVESKEAQVTHHTKCTDTRSSGDLACHLQTDLHYLQRVSKDHLRGSSLGKKNSSCSHIYFKIKNEMKQPKNISLLLISYVCSRWIWVLLITTLHYIEYWEFYRYNLILQSSINIVT